MMTSGDIRMSDLHVTFGHACTQRLLAKSSASVPNPHCAASAWNSELLAKSAVNIGV